MQGKTIGAAAVGVAGVVALAWAGAGVVAGHRTEDALKALAQQPASPQAPLRLVKLTHDRGLLQSKGEADVSWSPGCEAEAGADAPLTMRVTYTVSHLPLPQALVRFDWQAHPTGEAEAALKAVFGSAATTLTGQGSVSPTGAIRTDMSLPELSVQKSGEAVQIAASRGFLSVNGPALGFGWKVDRAVVRGGGQAVEMKDVALDMDLRNRALGTGTASVSVGQLSAGFGTMEGLSLKSEALENGDRLDVKVSPTLRRVQASGQVVENLALEFAVQGLDTRSIETMSTVFSASCGLKSATADEQERFRKAFNTLMVRGFSVGIPKLAAKAAEGSIDGRWLLTLAPARGQAPSLAEQLKSSGQIDVRGSALKPEQRDFAVAMGIAVEHEQGLRASYDYSDGLLKVNGRTLDAAQVKTALQGADLQMQVALSGPLGVPAVAQAPVPVPAQAPSPEPKEEVLAAAPAVPAAASPAPACPEISDCVARTLRVARSHDLDALRQVAGQIEALPKPELGNRAVARQHNAAALEALKRNDAPAAVEQLHQALRENPRDVEVVGNLGFALVKAGDPAAAVTVLESGLVLDPRRTSTWTPLAEALALAGRAEDAKAALWVAFQWSGNREKSVAYYQDRAANETRPTLKALYTAMLEQVPAPAIAAAR